MVKRLLVVATSFLIATMVLSACAKINTKDIFPTPTLLFSVGSEKVSPKDDMVVVFVSEGNFLMGSDEKQDELPVHLVFLDAFWIGKTEVTNAMYEKCVVSGDCTAPITDISRNRDSYYGNNLYSDYPVLYVRWEQAVEYCSWAGGTLPTEAQWEKAARGTLARTYPWGEEALSKELANVKGADTTKVGNYPDGKSPYGVLDMAGNVWEWVSDYYQEDYYKNSPASNPIGPESGEFKVLRGGSFAHDEDGLRSSYRTWGDPPVGFYGFRCVFNTDAVLNELSVLSVKSPEVTEKVPTEIATNTPIEVILSDSDKAQYVVENLNILISLENYDPSRETLHKFIDDLTVTIEQNKMLIELSKEPQSGDDSLYLAYDVIYVACFTIVVNQWDIDYISLVYPDRTNWVFEYSVSGFNNIQQIYKDSGPNSENMGFSVSPNVIARMTQGAFQSVESTSPYNDCNNYSSGYQTCIIKKANCSYQPATKGQPTFCNDGIYPNDRFRFVRWGKDISNLDGRCIILQGEITIYDGVPQISSNSDSQFRGYCD